MARAEIARRIREMMAACEMAVADVERGIGSIGAAREALDALAWELDDHPLHDTGKLDEMAKRLESLKEGA